MNSNLETQSAKVAIMMRTGFPIIVLVVISFLSILTVRHLRAVSATSGPVGDSTPRTPVLVELFTSEGCSSCPPADVLLERLDRSQPVRGAELIVLSEHVDYWNDIGWKDPYSSHEYSERQSAYAEHFGLRSIYTPQMVVDGNVELVGSDERRAVQAIENAKKAEKIPVSLSSVHFEANNTIALHVETGPFIAPITAQSANLLLAIADESDESRVSRGENAGRTLRHVAVLRNLVRAGTVDKTGKFSRDVTIDLRNASPRNVRIVAIVQEMTAGKVWGVGSARLSN
jgi:hypothetical protein